jgi:hypothetical protein
MRHRALIIFTLVIAALAAGAAYAQDETATPPPRQLPTETATASPLPTPLFGRPSTATPVPVIPTEAPAATPEEEELPAPHLGYGIHVGPHSQVPVEMVYNLNVDWVKLYDAAQVDDYPGLRVLYRYDIRPRTDLDAFRLEVIERTYELAALGVDAIEVGNEPNLMAEWPPFPNPEQFARELCVAYRAIKSIAPNMVVVSGGIAPGPAIEGLTMGDFEFTARMFAAGAKDCFDAFGYHPYGFNLPPETSPFDYEYGFRRAERMHALLEQYDLGHVQIWITEFGWVRTPTEEGLNCNADPDFYDFAWMQFPSEVVADYTVRAFQFADEHWPWAGPMFLWNLDFNTYSDDFMPACEQMRWFGILDRGGNPTATYWAYATSERRFSDYQPIIGTRTDDMTETVEAYCPTEVSIGSFEVINEGYPALFEAQIEPVIGPGIPLTRVSQDTARAGDEITVYVDTSDMEPGLHVIVVNAVTYRSGRRMSANVRGWVLAQPPTSPDCVANAPVD